MSSLSTFPGSGCAKGKNLWEWGIFGNGFYVFFLTQRRRGTPENLIVYLFVMDYDNKAAQIINLSFFICVYLRSSAFNYLLLDI